jgi:hypothetical protein
MSSTKAPAQAQTQVATPDQLAWAAGAFVCRGSLVPKGRGVEMVISTCDRELADRLQALFGTGKVYGPYGVTYRFRHVLSEVRVSRLLRVWEPWLTESSRRALAITLEYLEQERRGRREEE